MLSYYLKTQPTIKWTAPARAGRPVPRKLSGVVWEAHQELMAHGRLLDYAPFIFRISLANTGMFFWIIPHNISGSTES